MKTQLKALTAAMGLGLVLASGSAMAESTYGYDPAAGIVSATAHLKITVKIPKLILLRVGTAGSTTDEVVFTATPDVPASPVTDVSQPVTWTGAAAPTFTATASGSVVTASTWNNSSGGGSLTCAVTTPFAAGGLLASNVTVAATGALAHPGAHTGCGDTIALARNTLLNGSWTYTLDSTVLAAAAAGADSETITYTAVTL